REQTDLLLNGGRTGYADMRVLEPRCQLHDRSLIRECRIGGLEARQKLEECITPGSGHETVVGEEVAHDSSHAERSPESMLGTRQCRLRIGLVVEGLQAGWRWCEPTRRRLRGKNQPHGRLQRPIAGRITWHAQIRTNADLAVRSHDLAC